LGRNAPSGGQFRPRPRLRLSRYRATPGCDEDIINLINGSFPAASGVSKAVVVSEVIGIIEQKAGYHFLKSIKYIPGVAD
jgi:hypothetical protein